MISLDLRNEFEGEEVTVAWIKLYTDTGATGHGVVVRNDTCKPIKISIQRTN